MTETGSALYDKTIEQLDKAPDRLRGPEWLAELRDAASTAFRQLGFPGPKDEAWRFTSVRPVVRIPFDPAPRPAQTDLDSALATAGDVAAHRLIVENGRPGSLEALPRGVAAFTLAEALEQKVPGVAERLGKIARTDDGFAAQNAALFDTGLVIVTDANARVERPLHLLHLVGGSQRPAVAYPRVLIVARPGSELELVESHVKCGAVEHLENSVTEIALEENARIDHVRVHHGAPKSYAIGQLSVHQARDSRYRSRVITFGGTLFRLSLSVVLSGPGSECSLDGLFVTGTDEHTDHHTLVVHQSPHATSNQHYRGILDGSGQGVFDGIIVVARGAYKTDAHQQSRNLLLSPDAVVHTKPHLEIDADDVACSHGATVGRIDPAQLFYLRSRGIDEPSARAALVYAFAKEIIDRIADPAVQSWLAGAVAQRLPQGELIRNLS